MKINLKFLDLDSFSLTTSAPPEGMTVQSEHCRGV